MKIVLKDVDDKTIEIMRKIKNNEESCEGVSCRDCPLKYMGCGMLDEEKIKINAKKHKIILTPKA